MKGFSTVILITYLFFLDGYVQALAVSKKTVEGEKAEVYEITQTDEDQINELREQIAKLQQAVSEITRSFSALELVAKNPSMMKNLAEEPKTRIERDVDAQSTSPPSSPNDELNPVAAGSYVWPMLSGQCFTCPAGTPGPRGPAGPQGIAGRDGRDGRDALTKPREPASGPPHPTESSSEPDIQPVGHSSQSGVIYIRWGNKECPENAELIYKGTVGGAYYSHSGSGSNYLCMPDEPIYDEIESSEHGYRATLYSSEYQYGAFPRLDQKTEHTPTCAVCKAPSGRTTKLMIPARNVCPSDEWRLEYAGYLMAAAAASTHQRTEFVCVDREMDTEPDTSGDENGALLYLVEGRCLEGAGLPCGPYISNLLALSVPFKAYYAY